MGAPRIVGKLNDAAVRGGMPKLRLAGASSSSESRMLDVAGDLGSAWACATILGIGSVDCTAPAAGNDGASAGNDGVPPNSCQRWPGSLIELHTSGDEGKAVLIAVGSAGARLCAGSSVKEAWDEGASEKAELRYVPPNDDADP